MSSLKDLHMRMKFSLLQSRHWQGRKKKPNQKTQQENAAVWSPWMENSALRWQQHYQSSQRNALVVCQSPPGITSRYFTSEPCWQFARQESWNAPVLFLWGKHRGQTSICRRNSKEKGRPGRETGRTGDHQEHYQVVDFHGIDRFIQNNGTSYLYTYRCVCALDRSPWLQKKMVILPLLKG